MTLKDRTESMGSATCSDLLVLMLLHCAALACHVSPKVNRFLAYLFPQVEATDPGLQMSAVSMSILAVTTFS